MLSIPSYSSTRAASRVTHRTFCESFIFRSKSKPRLVCSRSRI
jgi:hypothetical protein